MLVALAFEVPPVGRLDHVGGPLGAGLLNEPERAAAPPNWPHRPRATS